MAPKKRGWLLIPVVLFLVITGISWPFLDSEEAPKSVQTAAKDVVVLNWKWNKSVKGHIFAVFGELENRGKVDLKEVVLELRTMDSDRNSLNRHRFPAGSMAAGQRKHFRHDVPRTGQEAEGFLEVVETVSAP